MPLKEGGSEATRSANIGMLIREYRRTGKIGNITPRNAEHAREVASAIAYRQAREAGARIPKPRG